MFSPRVGLAYGPGVAELLAADPQLADYIEIPFEQLRHAPALLALQHTAPLVLHCASLSVAGFVSPSTTTVAAVAELARVVDTPWIGEHLAFIAADPLPGEQDHPGAAATALTYTVCPQLSEETVERVAANLAALRPQLPVPLILENSPQYFAVPGSTMDMSDFISAVAARCDVGLLLDLSHFLITSMNTDTDPLRELERLPLERVVEVHVSGLKQQSGRAWDDHAVPASPRVFELLKRVLKRARPRAVTFEYNWSPHFPMKVLREHIEKVRTLLATA